MTAARGRAWRRLARALSNLSVIWAGAMFGFFFAWTTSAMPGLDALDAQTAIAAMQSMNVWVRNPVFGTVFFGTPMVIGLAAAASLRAGAPDAAWLQVLAVMAFVTGVTLLTLSVHVPLNEGLAEHRFPMEAQAARALWTHYSDPWQSYNLIRLVVSGAVLCLLVMALGKTPQCHNA